MAKKILFVQFRTDVSLAHEQLCVNEMLGLKDGELVFVNAIEIDVTTVDLTDVAGIVLGGCGEFYLTREDGIGSWRDATMRFLDTVLEKNIPLFATCFGFQFLALHEGAIIVQDLDAAETGTFEISLLDGARDDELFKDLPERFWAQLGHKDILTDVPDHLIPLACSEKVAVQAFRFKGKPVWGLLFHAELNKQSMIERLDLYPDYADEIIETKKNLQETPEAGGILKKFVSMVLGA
ncbi:MAG: gamma-glutamyl-gamma-aminobutyrate hydrolase family protein [Candidatus Magasanikbacteria bacterium]